MVILYMNKHAIPINVSVDEPLVGYHLAAATTTTISEVDGKIDAVKPCG